MSPKLLCVLLLSVLFSTAQAQEDRTQWVDSVFSTLNRQEKVAQLFMVNTPANPTDQEYDKLVDLVEDGIGGVYITRGGPVRHAALMNKLQKASARRLLVGTTAEWGLGQTLDSIKGFQKPMVVGAATSDSLTAAWGRAIARQMKDLGFHINFAPNADDEIFNDDYLRYFSDSETRIGNHASTFVRAMQSEEIIAVAKHLPRRWTNERRLSDSMVVLNLNRIDTNTLHPFQQLIANNIGGISTSYLHFSIQGEKGIVPASVSQPFISDVLKKMLGFGGLVFSDARNIQKKEGKVRAGEAELLAFQSGADIIFNPANAPAGIKMISKVVRKNKFLLQQLDSSVKKILNTKYDVGLHTITPINTDNLYRRLNNPEYGSLNLALASAAVTIVQNTDSLLPLKYIEERSFVSMAIGNASSNNFEQALKKYAHFRSYGIQSAADTVVVAAQPQDVFIIGIFPYATALEQKVAAWINRLAAKHKVILVHFGNPKSLDRYTRAAALVAAYTDQDYMPSVSAQLIFGALAAGGELPLSTSQWMPGASIKTTQLGRLSFAVPESAGISSRALEKIKMVMEEAVATQSAPGAYALIVKDGKVVFEQAVGWLTYEKQQPVNEETIYDLASMTKVLGTVQIMMFLYEKGLIDINKKASFYLPELQGTNKEDLTIIDILTHQSGLLPFIPLWPKTMDGQNEFDPHYYSHSRSEAYPLQVGPDMYGAVHLKDSLWRWTLASNLLEKPARTPYSFRYSDLGPWILYMLAEKLLNQPIDEFLQQNIYDPIGAWTTGYLPLSRFDASMIAPTEKDTTFRKGLLVGTVHDERAAMLGGVAGHAGLFSNAGDVAKLGQMLLQRGYYGGHQYFKPETVDLFTRKQFKPSRRGLGWDKPIQSDWSSPTSLSASAETYGHTGFTGTCIWIDPEFNLVFVFLSNRVHPDRNSKFNSSNIRSRIQEIIYQSIFAYCAEK